MAATTASPGGTSDTTNDTNECVHGSNTRKHQQSRNTDNDGNENSDEIVCKVCVRNTLKPYFENRKSAYEEWLLQRTECSNYFTSLHNNPVQTTDDENSSVIPSNKFSSYNNCSNHNNYDDVIQLSERRKSLKEHISKLQMACSTEAVNLYKLRIDNEERATHIQSQREVISQQKHALDRMREILLVQHPLQSQSFHDTSSSSTNATNGAVVTSLSENTSSLSSVSISSFQHAINETRERVKRIRFQWAIQSFLMYKIQVDNDQHRNQQHHQQQPQTQQKSSNDSYIPKDDNHKNANPINPSVGSPAGTVVVSGIGKISGLPLPHKGLELYNFLPPNELQSALRLVATLTSIVSSCLGIHLPHPILLKPPPPTPPTTPNGQKQAPMSHGDAISNQMQYQQQHSNNHQFSTPSPRSLLSAISSSSSSAARQVKPQPPIHANNKRNPYYNYQYYVDHDIAATSTIPSNKNFSIYNTGSLAIQRHHDDHLQQQQQQKQTSKQPLNAVATGFSSLLQSVGNRIQPLTASATTTSAGVPNVNSTSSRSTSSTAQNGEVATDNSPSSHAVSMDPDKVRMRLYHSTAAVIAEDSTFQSAYALKLHTTGTTNNDNNPSTTITSTTKTNSISSTVGTTSGTDTLSTTTKSMNTPSSTTNATTRGVLSSSSRNSSSSPSDKMNYNDINNSNNPSSDNTATNKSNNNTDTNNNNNNNSTIVIIEDFVVALQLLQNNIITLCIRAGVPVHRLWPAVAVLLNLNELYMFLCEENNNNNNEETKKGINSQQTATNLIK